MTTLLPERIQKWLDEVDDLPTLPEVPTRVLQMSGDNEIPLSEISAVIERDPPLTTNILRIANSAFYGFSQRVSTLQTAMALLGLNEIVNIVCSVSVVSMFGRSGERPYLSAEGFWRHSVGCGLAAQMLSRRFKFDGHGVEFVAGLIHDIGVLICAQYLPGQYRQIREIMEHTSCEMSEAEEEVLGTTHCELGAWMAHRWHLPQILVEGIRFHHAPLDALAQATPSDQPALAAVIHLADRVANEPDLCFTESNASLPPLERDVAWRIILAESPKSFPEEVEAYATAFAEQRPRVGHLLAAVV